MFIRCTRFKAAGDNTDTTHAGRLLRRFIGPAVAVGLMAALSTTASGRAAIDYVTYWNEVAENASAPAGAGPIRSRIMAMVQVAVHDALNAIQPRFESYTSVPSALPGASPEAAVAAATYEVLAATVPPAQAATALTLYNQWISQLSACPACVTDGIVTGQAAASAILSLRQNDGSATPHLPYTLAPGLGVYQPTPPGNLAPQFAGWANVTPFVLHSGSQFRADPSEVFDLLGEAYTRDFNEVKRVGSTTAEATGNRTPDQSAIARFWPGGGSNFNAVTRVIVTGRGLDPWEHARLLALVNMATSDAAVTVYDTKYTYNFWRPVTAIRAAATDGNPDTTADASWLPNQGTPAYPDYTCGLTTNVGAAVEVLRRYFGTDDIAYTFTAAGITRSYSSLSQAAAEAVDARVFGGMHFRTGCVQGVRQGGNVGRFVIQHALKPLKQSGKD